ncbi:hypothetical protein HGRIS_009648 [Hohenbuehelia grisea]|uniref:Transcription factor IIIC subunit 5 HTH domain-containing protein n=1 Tax=Hohenbuehelia grisea TaxID=104357 RepID=A0ABR3J278_9AGAR
MNIHKFRIPEEKEEYIVPSLEQPSTNVDLDPQLLDTTASASASQAATTGGTEPIASGSRSNLRMFPPPIFSRQAIPLNYGYKANPASVVSTIVDEETGEERKRMINRMRWKGYGPASIAYADEKVPDAPPSSVESLRNSADEKFLVRLQALFVDRPIWTRMSLMNQFTANEARDILNSKILLPLVCYVFQDGPWRDTLIRLKYDPRKDREARFYQRLYFRNANHPIERPSVATRRQERASKPADQGEKDGDRKTSHVFDGITLTKETAAFQLCDITDPMLKEMIEGTDDLRDVCEERDGWYSALAFEQIKTVLRHKFFSLLEGYQASDEDCWAILESGNGGRKAVRPHRLQPRKHNMAKGALRPEDAAAVRLQATLDRNARKNLTQR